MVSEGSSTSWGLDNHVRRKLILIHMIILAMGLGVASGAHPPALRNSDGSTEPSALESEDELRCTRSLIDVIQGFAVTLVSLWVAVWGSVKYGGDGRWGRISTLAFIFTPLTDVARNFVRSSMCVLLLWENCKFPDNATVEKPSPSVVFKRFFKSLLPWKKSPATILASCNIVVYTLAGSALHTNAELSHKYNMVCSEGFRYVQDEKEALIVGTRIDGNELRQNRYIRREMLQYRGILLLIQGKVVPDFDQLKFLRGKSGYAMMAIAVQAFGYIYAVVYRSATHLRVTPLEVIGLVLNIGLLINVSTFSTCPPCHRPLVIYVNHELDDRLVQFLSEREPEDLKSDHMLLSEVVWVRSCVGILTMMGLGLVSVVIYYTISMSLAVSNLRVVIPFILFSVVIFLNITLFVMTMMCYQDEPAANIIIFNRSLSAVVYVWATVMTVKYWDSEHFNTRAPPNLSDLVPFVGYGSTLYVTTMRHGIKSLFMCEVFVPQRIQEARIQGYVSFSCHP